MDLLTLLPETIAESVLNHAVVIEPEQDHELSSEITFPLVLLEFHGLKQTHKDSELDSFLLKGDTVLSRLIVIGLADQSHVVRNFSLDLHGTRLRQRLHEGGGDQMSVLP